MVTSTTALSHCELIVKSLPLLPPSLEVGGGGRAWQAPGLAEAAGPQVMDYLLTSFSPHTQRIPWTLDQL